MSLRELADSKGNFSLNKKCDSRNKVDRGNQKLFQLETIFTKKENTEKIL